MTIRCVQPTFAIRTTHGSSTANGPVRPTPTSPSTIRLIAQGRFTDAYMLNRESNVFPGILGRTCDRPCEPACRRGRIDGKPVAICRLKRVAADNRGEVKHLLRAPAERNGKKIALDRRRAGVAHRRQRPGTARLLGHDFREAAATRRPDAGQHPGVPASRTGPGRGDRVHHRHGRGGPLQHTSRQPEDAPRRGRVRRGVRGERRAEGQRAGGSRPARHRPDLHRHRLARVDPLRPRRLSRQARADHRRRQHGDRCCRSWQKPSWRHGREGHRAQDAEVLQGLAVGARGRRGRKASRSSSTFSPCGSSSRTAC